MAELTSKSVDVDEAYCPGCGYYRSTMGHHRADCTAPTQEATA